jgi:hypothetical protein
MGLGVRVGCRLYLLYTTLFLEAAAGNGFVDVTKQ